MTPKLGADGIRKSLSDLRVHPVVRNAGPVPWAELNKETEWVNRNEVAYLFPR